jgi:hypothetical protein
VKPLARSGRFTGQWDLLRSDILNSHEHVTEVGKRDKPAN